MFTIRFDPSLVTIFANVHTQVTASEDVAITSELLATDGRDRNHGTPLALHTCYKFPSVLLPFPPCPSLPLSSLLIPS